MQRQNSAIGTMLHEHEEARKLAEQIKTAVNLYLTDKNTEHAKSLVIQSCGAYVDRIERHILKDDTRLFVMAERRLNGRENDVSSAIAEVEADKMGTDARIKYEQKADRYLHWFSKMET